MQESVEYVNTQSPNILEQLDHLYKKYVQELQKIHHRGTTGKYLDPYEDSSQVLEELKTVSDVSRQASWHGGTKT